MANSIIRPLQRTSKTILLLLLRQPPKIKPITIIDNLKHSCYYTPTRTLTSQIGKDASQLNLLNRLRHEIRYELETSPPSQPVPEFNSFSVDEKPTEQWILLTRRFKDIEEIKVEVTMFDKSTLGKKLRVDEDVVPHASMLVGIRKGERNDVLEFVCSVWPDSIKIHEVYTRHEKQAGQPYMGPGFRDLDDELQHSLYDYLKERGIDKELATFLHKYMKNKDKSEFVGWMERVNFFIEMKNDTKIIR